jgi:hypothetical protein
MWSNKGEGGDEKTKDVDVDVAKDAFSQRLERRGDVGFSYLEDREGNESP